MKPLATLDEIAAVYDEGLAKGRTPVEAVGWNVPHSQLANFLALLRVEGLGDGARVLDVGCGLGALKDALDAAGLRVDYTGVDISARMVAEASARRPDARFERRDILSDPPKERYDFVLCSGTLNLTVADHSAFLARMIGAMFALCTRALSFNLLSAHELARNPGLQQDPGRYHYAWPEDVFRFCATLSPFVTLDHASRATTFTVHVYRRNPAPAERYLARRPPSGRFDPDAAACLGYLKELGLRDEAEAFLAGIEPSVELLVERAGLRIGHGDIDGARVWAERAAALAPESAPVAVCLAYIALRQHRVDEAAQMVARARTLAPRDPSTLEAEVFISLRRGLRAEAAAAAAKLDDSPQRDYLLGITAADPHDAEEHLRRAVERAPRLVDALVRLAELLDRRGAFAQSDPLWRRAVDLAPTDPRLAQRVAARGR